MKNFSKVVQLIVILVITLGAEAFGATIPANGKLKIFILAGQENMVGYGQLVGGPGTMEHYLKIKPKEYAHTIDKNGKYMVRNDVWIVNLSDEKNPLQGWLTVGYGASKDYIGPEYGFGLRTGDAYEDPILIIKSAWAGKSLAYHFLSPSSEDYPKPEKDGDKGFQYAEILRHVREITGNLKKYFPGYSGLGYEIVGFGWHQGWDDRTDQKLVDAYENNLVNFLNDMRTDLRVPNLAFVIANTGMSGWDDPLTYKEKLNKLVEAQLSLADPKKHPNLKGSVAGVETRGFQRTLEESPSKVASVWLNNWESYYLIGSTMGEAVREISYSRIKNKSGRNNDNIRFFSERGPISLSYHE